MCSLSKHWTNTEILGTTCDEFLCNLYPEVTIWEKLYLVTLLNATLKIQTVQIASKSGTLVYEYLNALCFYQMAKPWNCVIKRDAETSAPSWMLYFWVTNTILGRNTSIYGDWDNTLCWSVFLAKKFGFFVHVLWNLFVTVSSNLLLNMVMEFNSIGLTVPIFRTVDWDGNNTYSNFNYLFTFISLFWINALVVSIVVHLIETYDN